MKKIIMAIVCGILAAGIGFAAVGCGGGGSDSEYTINVGAGGSGAGISQTHSGAIDMGMASSKVEGEDAEGIEVYAICQDGIAVVVNKANTIENLTLAQLKDIYTGKITTWEAAGSTSVTGTILIGAREEGSGTRDAFLELIGVEDESTLATASIEATSTGSLRDYVAGQANAIGYVSLGSITDAVRATKIEGVEATTDNVLNETYQLARPFNVMYQQSRMDSNDLMQDFFKFLQSQQAHDIIVDAGYVSDLSTAPEYTVPETLPTTMTLDIAGSTSVQPPMVTLSEAYVALLNAELNSSAE